MCENVNINVSETNETINIVSSEIQEVIDINVFETTEDVTLNITEQLIQVNVNKVTSAAVTNTSELINDGEDGVHPFITSEDLPSLTGYVPYTGATEDVNLGEFGLLTGNVEFDNTPTNIPTTAGAMYWNDADGTADLILKGGNVKLQIGQESVIRVVNKTATNINLLEANYQAVRVTGAQGQRLKVDLAQATTDNLSAETIGLVTETINNNQEGFITTSGLVRNINTTGSLQGETWADGDILYLSPTTAGNITKVKPTAPNHLVIVGYVVYAHANNGSIFVKVDNGYELDELHNVKITSAANNNVLAYTSATDIWENKTVETALGFTPENVANKSTSTSLGTSNTLYPTQNAVKVYADTKFTLPALTSGSVLFSDGTTIAQDNAQLFWNDTNNRLGIGTNAPTNQLTITNSEGSINPLRINIAGNGGIQLNRTGTNTGQVELKVLSLGDAQLVCGRNLSFFSGATEALKLVGSTGNFLINTTTDTGYRLDVNGTARSQVYHTNFGTNSINLLTSAQTAQTADRGIFIGSGTYSNSSIVSVGIGANINVSANGSTAIGWSATSTGGGIALSSGIGAGATSTGGIAIGAASNSGASGIAIGGNSTGIGSIGIGASASAQRSVSIGQGCSTTAAHALSIGDRSIASGRNSIAIGFFSLATTNGDFVAGGITTGATDYGIYNVYFGSGKQGDGVLSIAGQSYTINGSGAFGTNLAGGNVTIAGGKGTGTGTSGDVIISTATPTTTGTTLQTLTERMRVFGNTGNVLIQNGGTFTDSGHKLNVNGTIKFGLYGNLNGNISSNIGEFLQPSTLISSGNYNIGLGSQVSIASNATIGIYYQRTNFDFALTSAVEVRGTGDGSFSDLRLMKSGGSVLIGTTTAIASSLLTMNSTTRGFLPPRMTTTEKNAIATPAAGLVVYDTTDNKHYGYNGTTWNAFY